MKDSNVYQMILEDGLAKGKVDESKRIPPIIGRDRGGEPDLRVVETIESLDDPVRIEALLKQSFRASDWEEPVAGTPEEV